MNQIVYLTDGFWREYGDKRVQANYPLMSRGPLPVILIVAAYLYLVRFLLPSWMKSRQPFNLNWTIRLYNIAISIANLYIFVRYCQLTKFGFNLFGCKQTEVEQPRNNELITVSFIYSASKVVELLDTVFFVMRKKYNQASNLHVFHHSFMIICCWVFFKIAPDGTTLLFPLLNSGIHTIMYTYYFLATFKGLQAYLWWKRYLTSLQMAQFVLSIIHFLFQTVSGCKYPPVLAAIGVTFNMVFVVLFANFYRLSYLKKGSTEVNIELKGKRRIQ